MPRVAILCDYAEEGWPSMDLVGDMLLTHLNAHSHFEAVRIRPAMKRRLTLNADRLINRFWHYPQAARKLSGFDLYHVVDHSYSQLVHVLPAHRTVVTCHDTDTFRCLLEPDREPRPLWFRAMAARSLSGLRKAAAIACVSDATREQLLRHRVASPERIHVIHNGVHPSYSPDPDPVWDTEASRLLSAPHPASPAGPAGWIDVLHVGSTIPRKRIDVLLRVIAQGSESLPVRLIRVGGALTSDQQELAQSLGITDRILALPFLETPLLAAIYRRAAMVLVTSEAEGFGLPLAEAMACGTPVLASDISALREVGQDAASYSPVADIAHWTAHVTALLQERGGDPVAWRQRVAAGLERAKFFSWVQHAREVAALYTTLLSADLRAWAGEIEESFE